MSPTNQSTEKERAVLHFTPSIIVGVGELFLQTGKQARGLELMTLALHYPVSDQDTKDRAQRILTHIYSKLGVQNRTLAIIRARQLNLLP